MVPSFHVKWKWLAGLSRTHMLIQFRCDGTPNSKGNLRFIKSLSHFTEVSLIFERSPLPFPSASRPPTTFCLQSKNVFGCSLSHWCSLPLSSSSFRNQRRLTSEAEIVAPAFP